jgi:hypothetical protein
VDDHLVAHFPLRHILAGLVDNSRSVAAADVKIFRLALFVAGFDDVDRHTQARPHVVVVDAGGHHVDEHLVIGDGGNIDHLFLEGLDRVAKALFAHNPGVHFFRNFTQWGLIADLVQLFAHSVSSFLINNSDESAGEKRESI